MKNLFKYTPFSVVILNMYILFLDLDQKVHILKNEKKSRVFFKDISFALMFNLVNIRAGFIFVITMCIIFFCKFR